MSIHGRPTFVYHEMKLFDLERVLYVKDRDDTALLN